VENFEWKRQRIVEGVAEETLDERLTVLLGVLGYEEQAEDLVKEYRRIREAIPRGNPVDTDVVELATLLTAIVLDQKCRIEELEKKSHCRQPYRGSGTHTISH